MVEEVTFQVKESFKRLYTINQILVIAERVQLPKIIHIKCFCEGKRKHDTIIPFLISTLYSQDFAEHIN